MKMRRLSFVLLFLLSIAPAFGQVPPPVPALPDAERRTSYSISGTNCACNVGFALFGDSTDFQNWVEVYLNGILVNFNDPTFGWTISVPTQTLATRSRPISDAILTFTNTQTGTVQIVGARRPRRTSQFNEGTGVPTRNFNVVLSDIIAQNREIWDKTNDFTGRGLFGLPGETLGPLPSAATRAGNFFIWDGSGNPSVTSPTLGTGNVLGPGSSALNGFARWNNLTGTLLKDGGALLATADYTNNSVTPAKMAQGIANSIWINPTGSTANMQNLAVPACANDGAHGLVYVNGTGLLCATMTAAGTVTSAQIAAGNIALTTSGTCTITTSGVCTITPSVPYFQAVLATDQTVTTTVTAKLSFSSENFDSNNWYDNATNFRFTPLLAGKYLVNLQISCNGTNVTSCTASIFKNGSTLSNATNASSAASQTLVTSTVTAIVSFNGSTDFIEGDANVACTGTCKVLSSTGAFTQSSIFQAHYISP